MIEVLNGSVTVGDSVAYSSRKSWGMYTRVGVVVAIDGRRLMISVTRSSDGREIERIVSVRKLNCVVKVP